MVVAYFLPLLLDCELLEASVGIECHLVNVCEMFMFSQGLTSSKRRKLELSMKVFLGVPTVVQLVKS